MFLHQSHYFKRNQNAQRAIICPATGTVSISGSKSNGRQKCLAFFPSAWPICWQLGLPGSPRITHPAVPSAETSSAVNSADVKVVDQSRHVSSAKHRQSMDIVLQSSRVNPKLFFSSKTLLFLNHNFSIFNNGINKINSKVILKHLIIGSVKKTISAFSRLRCCRY